MQLKVNGTREANIAGWTEARCPQRQAVREHRLQPGTNETATTHEPGQHPVAGERIRGGRWGQKPGASTFKKHAGKHSIRASW